MKLIRTFQDNGQPFGYFDHATKCAYWVQTTNTHEGGTSRVVAADGTGLTVVLSASYATKADALTELDRIAALIGGEAAPAQGWVKGPPPCIPDARFLVADCEGDFSVVRWMPENPYGEWVYGPENEISYPNGSITHHIPTPIQPPKES